MKYAPRLLGPGLLKAARAFPALILTGPRRAGKTTLLRRLFPGARNVLLEDPEVVGRVRADPNGFLDDLRPPVILDEIQNAPELFNHVRARIDAHPRRCGQWLFTGSQEAPLMKGVTESMAGRAAVFRLFPLSLAESSRVSPFHGGFPEALARPASAGIWFSSYLQTYLERDVRAISSIRELSTFRRFLSLVASRCGGMLNKTDLAAPMGISVPTVTEWLSILEITGQIILVPPYFENFGKRLVRSPKLYFADSGLACHLLGIPSAAALRSSPFLGPIFEGFVASEILKHRVNQGRAANLYHFRDERGLEVDFVVDRGDRRLVLIEAKATRTPSPDMARPMVSLAGSIPGYKVRSCVVHDSSRPGGNPVALFPGVKAVSVEGLADFMEAR